MTDQGNGAYQKTAQKGARPPRGQGREALLAAVTRIVARKGIDGVTLRAVAAEAGVTHGLATYYFPSREVMLEEAFTWAVQEAIGSMGITSADGQSLMEYAVDFVSDKPEEMTFQFELIFHGQRSEPVARHVRRMYESYIEAIQSSLGRSGLPSDRRTAKLALAVMDGLAVQQLTFGDPKDSLDTGNLFISLLAALSHSPAESGDTSSG
ncbi:MAG: TetR/AcrR family transcriptional regulator [Thermoleophilia bacterium]